MRRSPRFLLGAVLLIAWTSAVGGEHPNTERGVQPGKAYQIGDIDEVNAFTGHLNVTLPIGQTYHVGGALSYQFQLHHNSYAWDMGARLYDVYQVPEGLINYEQEYFYPSLSSNAGFGWILSLGGLGPVSEGGGPIECCGLASYRSPDGALHDFTTKVHNNDANEPEYVNGTVQSLAAVGYTSDGTHLREKVWIDSALWYEIDFPDGTIHKFDSLGRITEMADAFGNRVVIAYESLSGGWTRWHLSEYPVGFSTARREHYVNFRPSVSWTEGNVTHKYDVVDSVDLAGFNGGRSVYTMSYTPVETFISRPCALELPIPPVMRVEGPTVHAQMLTSVATPELLSYAMTYDTGSVGNCSNKYAGSFSGTLTSLKTPSGASFEYDYQLYNFPQSAQTRGSAHTAVPGVKQRTIKNYDGTTIGWTTFSPELKGSSPPKRELVNTITQFDASGPISKTRNYFGVCATYYGMNPLIQESALQFCNDVGEYGLPFTQDVAAHPPDPGGRFLSTQTLDPLSDAVKRETYLKYEADGTMTATGVTTNPPTVLISWESFDANRRAVSSSTKYIDGGVERFATVDYSDYDGVGHYRQTVEGGTAGWATTRTSYTRYNPGMGTYSLDSTYHLNSGFIKPGVLIPWVLGTFTQQFEKEGNHAAASLSCFSAKGFLERRRTLAGDSPSDPVTALGQTDLLAIFTADSGGNTVAEEYKGGDATHNVPASDLCSMTLPDGASYKIVHSYGNGFLKSSRYFIGTSPMSFPLLDVDVDTNTGFVSAVRERSDGVRWLRTDFTYDLLGRLKTSLPTSAGGAAIEYSYDAPTSSTPPSVTVTTRTNGAGSILRTDTMRFDGLGQMTSETHKTATGATAERQTKYNHLGWKLWVSELGNLTKGTSYSYDYVGRPLSIVSADGSSVAMSYVGVWNTMRTVRNVTTGASAAVATSKDVTSKESYDRYGRLESVTEPSASGAADGTLTTYAYDIGGRLSLVCMAASNNSCGQTRTFTYDNRGFLLNETHPEKGSSGNSTTVYTNYDSRGHVGRRYEQNGTFDLSYIYDGAERVDTVKETAGRVLKKFSYGSQNFAGVNDERDDFSNGQLVSATRFNWFPETGINLKVEVTENYVYAGRDGRVSSRKTQERECQATDTACVDVGAGTLKRTFGQAFTWDDLGNAAGATYPSLALDNCGGACPSVPAAPTVTNTWSYGFLTNVSFPRATGTTQNAISYHPSGMVASVAHANGVTDSIAPDPNGMTRPLSFSSTGAYDQSVCTAASIVTGPASSAGAAGSSRTLTVTATGDSSTTAHQLSYQWYYGSSGDETHPVLVASATTPTLTDSPQGTTQYWVKVWNDCGAPARSVAATATVCVSPTVTTPPTQKVITRGQTATVTVFTSSNATAQWYEAGPNAGDTSRPVIGATSNTLSVSPQVNTGYWVRVSNGCGSVDSSTTYVVVSSPPLPPSTVTAWSDGTANHVSWSGARASSGGGVVAGYEIQRSDGQTFSATSSPFNDSNSIVAGKAYLYRVVTIDSNGYHSSRSIADATVVMIFTDDPVLGTVASPVPTPIQGIHIRELRQAIDALRQVAGLSALWPNPTTPTGLIYAADIQGLREKLDEVRRLLDLNPLSYARSDLQYRLVAADDINELRSGVK